MQSSNSDETLATPVEFCEYISGYISNEDISAQRVITEMQKLCQERFVQMFGKTIQMKRLSCVFGDDGIPEGYYAALTVYPWKTSELVRNLRQRAEEWSGDTYDYCLVQLYPDGNAPIAWHADNECLNSGVLSLSFGATRKFRLRRRGENAATSSNGSYAPEISCT